MYWKARAAIRMPEDRAVFSVRCEESWQHEGNHKLEKRQIELVSSRS